MFLQNFGNIAIAFTDHSDGSWDERFVPEDEAIQNRKHGCARLGIEVNNLVFANQTHSNTIKVASQKDQCLNYLGSTKLFHESGLDGLITDQAGIVLTILTADCLPVFFYDPIKSVVGLAHSGWKGTLAELPVAMVEVFKTTYGSAPADIEIRLGPSINKCCYRVDQTPDKRIDQFVERYGPQVQNEGFLDLRFALRTQLKQCGVRPEKIKLEAPCTGCTNDFFSSYREKKRHQGEQASLIWIAG